MKNFLTVLFSLIAVTLYGQTADMYLISSAGGDFTTQNEQITFTVGEVITESFSTSDLYINQGFLQSEDLPGVGVVEALNEDFSINVYPNPVEDYFHIDIVSTLNEEKDNHYAFTILDINGRVISNHNLFHKEADVNISDYLSGSYFIKITNTKGEMIKVVIIQKI